MTQSDTAGQPVAVIPQPLELTRREGRFTLGGRILVEPNAPATRRTAELLAATLRQGTGQEIAVEEASSGNPPEGAILLTSQGADASLGEEGYRLDVTPTATVIYATGDAGLFYGTQTLLQLLPPQILNRRRPAKGVEWTIPCVIVRDRPRFGWRGTLLDVCRHIVGVEEIKEFLDLMALHKLNRFHWHLTEDQGWRIEIKRYPKLTEISAWRRGIGFGMEPRESRGKGYNAAGQYGGFYTQDEIREIVAYAAERQIMIVPEIEMPGHCQAALAAYPELSCTGGPFEVLDRPLINKEVYCAGSDAVFEFNENVLREVFDLFPSPWIHIGADEVPKDRWKECPRCQERIRQEGLKDEHELQSWFIRRIEKFLNQHDRRLIGWDEILEGGLAPNATVMSWRGTSGGIAAAKAGHEVIMSPLTHCYLDLYQDHPDNQPRSNASGYVPLAKTYAYEPIPEELSADEARYILGAQGNIWTEYIPEYKHVEYMAMPRLAALAEVVWSPREHRNWDDFTGRLRCHYGRLHEMEVNYYHGAIETSLEAPPLPRPGQ